MGSFRSKIESNDDILSKHDINDDRYYNSIIVGLNNSFYDVVFYRLNEIFNDINNKIDLNVILLGFISQFSIHVPNDIIRYIIYYIGSFEAYYKDNKIKSIKYTINKEISKFHYESFKLIYLPNILNIKPNILNPFLDGIIYCINLQNYNLQNIEHKLNEDTNHCNNIINNYRNTNTPLTCILLIFGFKRFKEKSKKDRRIFEYKKVFSKHINSETKVHSNKLKNIIKEYFKHKIKKRKICIQMCELYDDMDKITNKGLQTAFCSIHYSMINNNVSNIIHSLMITHNM